MFNLNSALQVVTLLLFPVLGYFIYLFKTGAEAAVKTSAEEAARATIQQLKWPLELAQELQKTI